MVAFRCKVDGFGPVPARSQVARKFPYIGSNADGQLRDRFCEARAVNEASAGSRVAYFANALLWIPVVVVVVVVGLVCLFLCLFLCPT